MVAALLEAGPPARCPFTNLLGGGFSSTKLDYGQKVGTLILPSLLEDLVQYLFPGIRCVSFLDFLGLEVSEFNPLKVKLGDLKTDSPDRFVTRQLR